MEFHGLSESGLEAFRSLDGAEDKMLGNRERERERERERDADRRAERKKDRRGAYHQ